METRFDDRFSDPSARAADWESTYARLEQAELYWLTTVRADGRPHVTPLVGVAVDGAVHFVTGDDEQKARNLQHSDRVALTTGTNTWKQGTDVVVEGAAVRVTDASRLGEVCAAYQAKYGGDWIFEPGDGVVRHGDSHGLVFRVEPSKVMAFAKDPHGQTAFRF